MQSSNILFSESLSLQSLAEMPESIRNVLAEQHHLLEHEIERAYRITANPESTRAEMQEIIDALCKELHRISHFITLENSVASELYKMEQSCATEKAKYANETREARLASLEERVHRKSFEETIRAKHDEEVKEEATALLDKHTKSILETNAVLNEEKIMLAEELHQLRASNATLQKENAALKEEMQASRSVQIELTTRSVRQKRTITALKKQLSEAEEKTTQIVAEYDAKIEKQNKVHIKEITPLTKAHDEAQRQARQLHAELTRVRELASRVIESRTELEEFFYDALAQVKTEVIAERRRALAELSCGVSNKRVKDMSISNNHTKSSLLRLECQHKEQQEQQLLQQQLQLEHKDRLLLTDHPHSQRVDELSHHAISKNNYSNHSGPSSTLPTCRLSPSPPSSSYSGLLPLFDKRREWTLDKKGFPVLVSQPKTVNATRTAHTSNNTDNNNNTVQTQNKHQIKNGKTNDPCLEHRAKRTSIASNALVLSQHCPPPAYLALSCSRHGVNVNEVPRESAAVPVTSSTVVAPESTQVLDRELCLQREEKWEQEQHKNSKTQNPDDAKFAQRLTMSEWRELQKELSINELTSSNALQVIPQTNNNELTQLTSSQQNDTSATQPSSLLALSTNWRMNSATSLEELQTVNVRELSWADKERVIQYLFYLLQTRTRANRYKKITMKAKATEASAKKSTTSVKQVQINNNNNNNNNMENSESEHDANTNRTTQSAFPVAVPDDHVFLTQGAIEDV